MKGESNLDPMYTSILVGVASGLLVSAIGLILRALWLNLIKPAYENAIYKDVRIEGKWHGFFVNEYGEHDFEQLRKNGVNEYILEINRSGHSITGSLIGTSGGDEGRVYDVLGSFRNLILTSTIEAKNKIYIERGCLNLMVKNNGNKLEGYQTNYEDDDHEVYASKIVFSRNNA